MNINNFEEEFYPTIMKRGKKYYKEGRVLEVEKNNDIFTAQVEGSEIYEVRFNISEDGSITKANCNCPYEMLCKHEAAALLSIKERYFGKEKPSSSGRRSSALVRNLIANFAQRTQEQANIMVSDELRLLPEFRIGKNFIFMSLKIGTGKMYSVPSIEGLYNNFLTRAYKRYGKELEITHKAELLDDKSKTLLNIIGVFCSMYYSHTREIELDPEIFSKIADVYREDKLVINSSEYEVIGENPKITLNIEKASGGFNLTAPESGKMTFIGGRDSCAAILSTEHKIYSCTGEFAETLGLLLSCIQRNNKLYISKNDIAAFCSAVLKPVESMVTIEGGELLKDYEPPELVAGLYLDLIEEDKVGGRLSFKYGENTYPAFGKDNKNPCCDYFGEAKSRQLVLKYFNRDDTDERYPLSISGEDNIYGFLTEGMTELTQNMEIYATDSFRKMTVRPPAKVTLGIRPSGSLLELDINLENYDLSELTEMLNAYRKGKKFHRLKDGSFAQVPEETMKNFDEIMTALNIKDKNIIKGNFSIPQYRMLYLNSLKSDYEGIRVNRSSSFRALTEKYDNIQERLSEENPPQELSKIMREYQKFGYLWLKTISGYGFGGILADDMGLGKTLQAIALILDDKLNNPDYKTAFVVCPSSLALNWISEIEKFAPKLNAAVVSGTPSEREELINKAGEYDILITSYSYLTRDIPLYSDTEFGYHFIDEAQYIKNQTTQAAKSVKAIKSRVRFALTGTPVENSLAELWSIFDFIMPDYLFSYNHFKQKYETPIVKNSDNSAVMSLQNITSPFILRRLKKEVLTELPDKTEIMLTSEMTEDQRKLYAANLLKLKSTISGSELNGETRFNILAMITELRQICCDPSLIYENYKGGSAKLEQCLELVDSCVNSGHKVLLFSQFTSMLDIIRARLNEMNISNTSLTGQTKTKHRLDIVNEFNNSDTGVFLISLKAGGTGLNLTSADIVIHYDPWWNVAAENQASDRAYRIGQKNNVQIYKLISKNTIEEKIFELQKSKMKLAELAVGLDKNIMKMSADDILQLLE